MAQRGSTLAQTLSAQAAGTVVGSAISFDGDGGVNLGVLVNVTVITGTTPTADVKIQWSADAVNWFDAETPDVFTQITTVKGCAKVFTVKAAFARSSVTVAGTTPAVTGTVSFYPTR
jgi:hypothetical protein